MKKIVCESCGGSSFKLKNNAYICDFCGSKYDAESADNFTEKSLTDAKLVQLYLEAAKFQCKDDYANELKVLVSAMELDSKNALTLIKIGRCYRMLGFHDKAIEIYQKAIEIDAEAGTAYTNLGTIALLRQNWSQAATYYEKGLKLLDKNTDDYWTAYANYAIVIAKLGNQSSAKRMIDEAEQHGYANAAACRKMAGINKSGCYVATCVYGSYDCPQVWTLRRFRDDTLMKTPLGKIFVRTYYAISPTIVKLFGSSRFFKGICKSVLDTIVAKLRSKGVSSSQYFDINL